MYINFWTLNMRKTVVMKTGASRGKMCSQEGCYYIFLTREIRNSCNHEFHVLCIHLSVTAINVLETFSLRASYQAKRSPRGCISLLQSVGTPTKLRHQNSINFIASRVSKITCIIKWWCQHRSMDQAHSELR